MTKKEETKDIWPGDILLSFKCSVSLKRVNHVGNAQNDQLKTENANKKYIVNTLFLAAKQQLYIL